jgi:hypothetical protein
MSAAEAVDMKIKGAARRQIGASEALRKIFIVHSCVKVNESYENRPVCQLPREMKPFAG